jgi:hypothetical protein
LVVNQGFIHFALSIGTNLLNKQKMNNQNLLSIKTLLMGVVISAGTMIISCKTLPAQTISGTVKEKETGIAIPYANIALFDSTTTILMAGSISNDDGEFQINQAPAGNFKLRISAIGYETYLIEIEKKDVQDLNIDPIHLSIQDYMLDGVIIEAQRIRAKAEAGKTTFLINTSMQNASHTGVDILKLVPGIRVDIRQNISLEGSGDILILVDGRERDRSFLSQLNASQIDRVEVISNPSSRYDASVTGVINIILKKNRIAGVQGHVYGELPLSASEIYIFPNYSLNLGVGKFNVFTSYNGEMSYFDIAERTNRSYDNGNGLQQISSNQFIKQKNWSHRFHYGVDYFINRKNQLNFYANYNPYSNEHSGHVELLKDGVDPILWHAQKDDDDRNASGYYSIYYRHMFNEETGHELALDAGLFNMNGQNSIRYFNDETGYEQINSFNPSQQSFHVKADYLLPISKSLKFTSGAQARQRYMTDAETTDFGYENAILAAHGSLLFQHGKFDFNAGARYEQSITNLDGSHSEIISSWLPNLAVNYKATSKQSVNLTWRSSLTYPGFYQLNSYSSIEDPWSVYSGNPGLKPVLHQNARLEYLHRFENHFLSTRLFYHKMKDAINYLTLVNEQGVFNHHRYNLGDIHRYGLQVSGAFSFGRGAGIQPTLSVFNVRTEPNIVAHEKGISSRKQFAWATGISAYASLGRGFTAALIFQYSSPLNHVQGNYFESAQYFFSLEKNLGRGFKAGLVSAVPFSGKITYQGSDIYGPNFNSHYKGDIITSMVPAWIKFSYEFSSGKSHGRLPRNTEDPEERRRKGF